MFPVNDNCSARETRIKSFLTDQDAAIAVLLAAIHFEWAMRRAILSLGNSSNKTIRQDFTWSHGPDEYKKVWKKEVMLSRSIPGLPAVIKNWAKFLKAFRLRNVLVHGRGSCGLEYARPCVEEILQAARAVIDVCEAEGVNLFERLKVRRKPRLSSLHSPRIAAAEEMTDKMYSSNDPLPLKLAQDELI